MKITFKNSLMAAVCVIGLGSVVACGSKNEPVVPPTNLPAIPHTAENGTYTGTMKHKIADGNLSEGEAIEFKMEQLSTGADYLLFENFPIRALVRAVLGNEASDDDVNNIIELVGDVKYNVDYTAAAEKDGKIALNFTPKPLVIDLKSMGKVTVNVKTPATGEYVLETKKTTLSFIIESIMTGEVAIPNFNVITLDFEGTKK